MGGGRKASPFITYPVLASIYVPWRCCASFISCAITIGVNMGCRGLIPSLSMKMQCFGTTPMTRSMRSKENVNHFSPLQQHRNLILYKEEFMACHLWMEAGASERSNGVPFVVSLIQTPILASPVQQNWLTSRSKVLVVVVIP